MKSVLSLYFALGISLPLFAADPVLQLDLGGGGNLELILVQPGQFSQGSPNDESGRTAEEIAHPVTLTKPYYLGRFEITKGQFETFVKATGYKTEAEDGKSGGYGWDGQKLTQRAEFNWRNPGFPQTPAHPVCCVTWFDSQRFCEWLSRRTGRQFSLPSEAQWEYACRAGTQTPWHGSVDEIAWHKGNAGGATHPVGQLKANAWGFHDMSGNVWEWCQDWHGPYPSGAATDPLQTLENLSDKPRRILRGGGFLKDAAGARSATRFRNDPRSRNADNGFRVMTLTIDGVLPAAPVENPSPPKSPMPPSTPAAQPPIPAPSPPPATPPPSAPPVTHNSGKSGGFLIWGLLAAIGLGIFALIRKLRGIGGGVAPVTQALGATQRRSSEDNFEFVTAADGFWIQARANRGSRIRWSCQAGGAPLEGLLEYEPGPRGQFVYTGQPPENISAILIAAAAALGAATVQQEPIIHTYHTTSTPPPLPRSTPPPQPRSQPRYPSAY